MQYDPNLLRLARRLALTGAATAFSTLGLTAVTAKVALAEFEIQETQIEKGELEIEYRGAVHGGVPGGANLDEGGEDDEGLEEILEPGTRQSHDIEIQWSATNWLQLSVTTSFTQPLGGDLNLTSVEGEALFGLVARKGDGLGLAFDVEYEQAINHGEEEEANEIAFGPFVELANKAFLLTLNPLFTYQVGGNAETDGLGLDYGWRAQYKIAKKWAVAAEMFGEIEDLSHTGSFDEQEHSIGPTLLYVPGDDDDDNGNGNGNGETKAPGPPEMEISLNVGVQFGLTDATSDTAVKFQGAIGF